MHCKNITLLYVRTGRFSEALESADRLLSERKESSDFLQTKGFVLLTAGRFDEAISILKTALDIDPNNKKANLYMGVALSLKGEYRKADTFLKQAYLLSPEDIFVHFARIENSVRSGDKKNIDHFLEKLFGSFDKDTIIGSLKRLDKNNIIAPLSQKILADAIKTKMPIFAKKMSELKNIDTTAFENVKVFQIMFKDQKVVVVMPAYNAAQTLRKTWEEVMAQEIVDLVIVVDDGSRDETVSIAKKLPNTLVHIHEKNIGYGGNQKTCYKLALEAGGDIIIMVHPDYQYTPKLIPAMASLIGNGLYHCVLGSRILGGYAIKGGMPVWKYIANRFLTYVQNILITAKLSEYHTGYRAFSRELLERLPLEVNSNDFVFDNQMLSQILWFGYRVAEVSCPTKYFAEASSINLFRSIKYGFGCLDTAMKFRLAKLNFMSSKLFPEKVQS